MSSIQSVQGGSSAALVAAQKQVAPRAPSSAQESAAQESQESPAVTRAEAAKGDQQAIRKLARQQPVKAEAAPAESVDKGKGVNVLA